MFFTTILNSCSNKYYLLPKTFHTSFYGNLKYNVAIEIIVKGVPLLTERSLYLYLKIKVSPIFVILPQISSKTFPREAC